MSSMMDEIVGDGHTEVLVTGFAPYGSKHTINPAWEIVRALPVIIEPTQPGNTQVVLRTYPTAIKVSYKHVRQLVPELYQMYPRVRFFVHVGVHSGIQRCRLERRARKGPYQRCDVDGENPIEKENGDKAGKKTPDEVGSRVDVEGLVKRLLEEGSYDIEGSDEAGLFLCEFLYYTSLVEAQRLKDSEGRSIAGVFLHVPMGVSSEQLQLERDTLIRVIQEMVRLSQ